MNVNVRSLVRLIKNYRSIALGSFIVMAVLVFLLGKVPAMSEYPVLQYAVFFTSLFVIYLGISSYRKGRIRMISSILYDNCDPEGYLHIFGEFIDRLDDAEINTDIGAHDIRLGLEMYWLELCEGIIASGGYGDALELLNDLASVKPEKEAGLFEASLQHKLCFVNLSLGDTGKANEHLGKLENAVKGLKPKYRAVFEARTKGLRYRANMAQSKYEGAEQAFTELFDNAGNNYERAGFRFVLGQIYLNSGDAARAKEAFEYIIEHGNKLHIVKEAKEHLTRTELKC